MNHGVPLWERFWQKVLLEPHGCWVWVGAKSTAGYGWIMDERKRVPAHRAAYEMLVGPIPDGLHIDHLCRNRACVNPSHMEAVPSVVNIMRGEGICARHARMTHCARGHELAGDNLLILTHKNRTQRRCRICAKASGAVASRAYRARKKVVIARVPSHR